MSNEERESSEDAAVSVGEEPDDAATQKLKAKRKLEIGVAISDAGPCQKHLKVTIPREEIDRQYEESVNTLRKEAVVPGFRAGRAPKQLVVKRFKKQVSDQVKSALLMSSLEQIDAEYQLDPITQPQLNIETIVLPDDGPMQFEMDVEVRPEFDLPEYKGLKVVRPIVEITEKDVDLEVMHYLERHGQIVPKLEGVAEPGDYLTADLVFVRGDGKRLGELKETQFRLGSELRFQNGSIANISDKLAGVKPGESRKVEAKLGTAVDDALLRGATIAVQVRVHDLKRLRLPELNPEFLNSLDFDSVDSLRLSLRRDLQRRLDTEQRQSVRAQIVSALLQATPFELPSELVSREEKNTVARLVAQLKQGGMSDKEIDARAAEIKANAHETTRRTLKEFLLLAKIAEAEAIRVVEEDLALEIQMIAERTDESVRRVRARLEKEGGADALANQILDRKAIDRILETAQIEEVAAPITRPSAGVETLDYTLTALADESSTAEARAAAKSETVDGS
jgi:trigger factor